MTYRVRSTPAARTDPRPTSAISLGISIAGLAATHTHATGCPPLQRIIRPAFTILIIASALAYTTAVKQRAQHQTLRALVEELGEANTLHAEHCAVPDCQVTAVRSA